MRLDGELFYQMQVAWHRRDAALLRYESARAWAEQADNQWRMIQMVINNKFGVTLGTDVWLDIETGELSPLATPTTPAQEQQP